MVPRGNPAVVWRGRVDSTDQLGEGYHVVMNYLLMDTEPPVYSEPMSPSVGLGSQRIHERLIPLNNIISRTLLVLFKIIYYMKM